MRRKKKSIPDDPEQYARFVEAAEGQFDEDAEERLKETIKKILSKKPAKSRDSR